MQRIAAAAGCASDGAAGEGALRRVAGALLCERHGWATMRALAIAWGATAAMLLVGLVWLPLSRLDLAPRSLVDIARIAATLLAVLAAAEWTGRRLAGEGEPAARLLAAAADRLSVFCAVGLAAYAMTTAGGLLCYLVTSLGWPLRDAELAALDRALGFDWLAVLAVLNAAPAAAEALVFSYHATGTLVALAALWLAATGRALRLAEYVAAFALATLGVNIALLFVPAAGAYSHFRPDAALFSRFSPDAGAWHLAAFEELRNAPAPLFDLDRLAPLVTFPSFHTICGILVTYALRDTKALLLSAAALNGAMIVATLPEGGHYLVDVLAGATIAALSITLCRATLSRAGSGRP